MLLFLDKSSIKINIFYLDILGQNRTNLEGVA